MQGDVDELPSLAPVWIATEDDVDQLLRPARASVAVLTLQLAQTRREAELLERAAVADIDADVAASRLRLERTFAVERDALRHQLVAAIEDATAESALIVAAAREEADATVARAVQVALEELRGAPIAAASDGAPPSLRVVPEVAVAEAAAEPVIDEIPEASAPLTARAPEPAAAAPEAAAVVVAPDVAITPASGAGGNDRFLAFASPTAPPRPGGAWAKYLYADVILPLVAVLVVLMVLLAWVG